MLKLRLFGVYSAHHGINFPRKLRNSFHLCPPPRKSQNLLDDPSVTGHIPLDITKLPKPFFGLGPQPVDGLDED